MKTWMNPKVRDLWVAALVSGKYRQVRGYLVKDCISAGPSYCALGVLCEVYCDNVENIRNHINAGSFHDSYGRFENKQFPPLEVLEWAGMTTDFVDYVSRVNDDYGCKFDEIALMVEHCTN